MLGSDVLVETLANAGIEVCFLNPGTTEVQSIAALEGGNRIRPVMTLFEAVATGSADGYARMAGKPAMTLLHQGVGLANGLANLHNAQKAHMPVVNVVGQHSRNHQQYNVPLMSDVAAFAAPVSGWVREVAAPEDVGRDVSDAFAAAVGPPAQVATLIVPGDCTWSEAGQPQPAPSLLSSQPISADAVDAAAQALRAGEPSALVLGGPVIMTEDLEAAARIQAATGARIIGSRFCARMQRGAGRFEPEILPYLHKDAAADVANLRHAILVGAEQPATFFDLPDGGGAVLPKTCAVHNMVKPGGDFGGGLRALLHQHARVAARRAHVHALRGVGVAAPLVPLRPHALDRPQPARGHRAGGARGRGRRLGRGHGWQRGRRRRGRGRGLQRRRWRRRRC